MPTILLQLVDDTSPDFYENVGLPKRGDVIRIHSGGPETFGSYYQNNPKYRIVPMRGTVTDLLPLMESEPVTDIRNIPRTRLNRLVKLDPDVVVPGMRAADAVAVISRRVAITDPADLSVG